MSRKFIAVEEAAEARMKRLEFVTAYDALDDEFAVAFALINGRSDAGMKPAQAARAMGTTQPCRPTGKRPDRAFDPHAGAVRQGDPYPSAHQFRAGEAGQTGYGIGERGAQVSVEHCNVTPSNGLVI
jgi:hypothetical protein